MNFSKWPVEIFIDEWLSGQITKEEFKKLLNDRVKLKESYREYCKKFDCNYTDKSFEKYWK